MSNSLYPSCLQRLSAEDTSRQRVKMKTFEPIRTAADDKFCKTFSNFQKKLGMIFHENCLSADDSHEICLFRYF